jgi:hypothetical protein
VRATALFLFLFLFCLQVLFFCVDVESLKAKHEICEYCVLFFELFLSCDLLIRHLDKFSSFEEFSC